MMAKGLMRLLRALYRRVGRYLHRGDDRAEQPLIRECYTEADVARLERDGDLLDPVVTGVLCQAYRRLDPDHDEDWAWLGLTPEERYAAGGTDEQCRRWIAQAEAHLATHPADHKARIKRLYAHVAISQRARVRELHARHPELARRAAEAQRRAVREFVPCGLPPGPPRD